MKHKIIICERGSDCYDWEVVTADAMGVTVARGDLLDDEETARACAQAVIDVLDSKRLQERFG